MFKSAHQYLYAYGLSICLAILCSCINLLTSICTSMVYLSVAVLCLCLSLLTSICTSMVYLSVYSSSVFMSKSAHQYLYVYGLSICLAVLYLCLNLLTSICTSMVYLSSSYVFMSKPAHQHHAAGCQRGTFWPCGVPWVSSSPTVCEPALVWLWWPWSTPQHHLQHLAMLQRVSHLQMPRRWR